MITTRNRQDDLRKTLLIVESLRPGPDEIMVTADGCTDDTIAMLQSEFPLVRVFVNEKNIGSVVSRDRMLRVARGDLILALDDDSYPEQLNCLETISAIFQANPKLAVLHFPQRTDEYPETLTVAFANETYPTKSFPNSGAVIRRSMYLELPGFVPQFFHMYEEPDFALQCFGAGYDVRYDSSVTIRHHYSGQTRSELRNHHRHARNELWSTLIRCPLGLLPLMIGYRIMSQFRYAMRRGMRWVIREPYWWFLAMQGLPFSISKRNPIAYNRYWKWLRAG
jgi:GT2 family glycosyltransferase